MHFRFSTNGRPADILEIMILSAHAVHKARVAFVGWVSILSFLEEGQELGAYSEGLEHVNDHALAFWCAVEEKSA